MSEGLGVAVIGAGMAGKAHAAAYRVATTLYSPVAAAGPAGLDRRRERRVRLARRRAGSATSATTPSWQAIAEADDIDVVSVVIANSLHREVVEGLLAAGKHVLCEKPLCDTMDDARAMAEAAAAAAAAAPGSASPSGAPRASRSSAT